MPIEDQAVSEATDALTDAKAALDQASEAIDAAAEALGADPEGEPEKPASMNDQIRAKRRGPIGGSRAA